MFYKNMLVLNSMMTNLRALLELNMRTFYILKDLGVISVWATRKKLEKEIP